MAKKYGPGDKVFAKVRGYPPWPARVEGVADESPNRMKYHIFFYGTRETAVCKHEELYNYLDNKEKFGKPMKKRGFKEGIEQLEEEMGLTNKPNSTPALSRENTYDSESEGTLVIDETPHDKSAKKSNQKSTKSAASTSAVENAAPKSLKRKLEDVDKSISEPEPAKINRSSLSSSRRQQTPTQQPATETSPQSDSSTKKDEPTSRSGRKIKPKKFADDQNEETASIPEVTPTSKSLNASIKISPLQASSSKASKKSGDSNNDDISVSESNKSKESDQTSDSKSPAEETMIAITPGGQEVKIELNKTTNFKNEKARLQWQMNTQKKASELKASIESGEVIPDCVKKEVEEKYYTRRSNIDEVSKSCSADDKEKKLPYLRTETQLLDIDLSIKNSLSIAQADPEQCLRIMDELLELNITALMLKKHPQLVETIKKLRKYIGNTSRWSMTEEERSLFASKAALIRVKAEHIYNKFKTIFSVPEGKTFSEAFAAELLQFGKKTETLNLDQIFKLVNEPAARNTETESEAATVE